jgi:hypothetical protein
MSRPFFNKNNQQLMHKSKTELMQAINEKPNQLAKCFFPVSRIITLPAG